MADERNTWVEQEAQEEDKARAKRETSNK